MPVGWDENYELVLLVLRDIQHKGCSNMNTGTTCTHHSNVDEELRDGLGVVLHDHGQQNGIADPVRQVVEAAELVGHGVHVAERGVVERNAGQVLSISHHLAGLGVSKEAAEILRGVGKQAGVTRRGQ